MARMTGLEPAASGVTGRRSRPTELHPHEMVPTERIELPTFGLQNRCTTAVLYGRYELLVQGFEPWLPAFKADVLFKLDEHVGGPARIRTWTAL